MSSRLGVLGVPNWQKTLGQIQDIVVKESRHEYWEARRTAKRKLAKGKEMAYSELYGKLKSKEGEKNL